MENNYERLLEAYFASTLTQAEQDEMKVLLANDPDFAAEFAWRQSVARAIRAGTANDPTYLKLKELERRFRFRKVTLQISAVAATILLLIFAAKFIPNLLSKDNTPVNAVVQDSTLHKRTSQPQSDIQSPTVEELRQDSIDAAEKLRQQKEQSKKKSLQDSIQKAVVVNFQPYDNISKYNTAAGVAEKDSMAVRAFILYDQKQYKQAAQAFEPLIAADPGVMENQFYYGVSLLGNKQFAAAATTFQKVAIQQSKYQTPAKFYLGMAHSGAGQFKEARQAFEDYLVAPKNGQFKDLAAEMLKKLPKQ